jgi:glycosyltransferase involved in cell wall biosynthesis
MPPSDAPAPLVSVVIPTYNYARFVSEAVDSVLAQTYPSLEVVVVDDGSTDDTREVLARYGDRIRYIYQPNAGLPAARNTGIKAARGEFIGLLDSDDVFHPRKFELQMRYMLAHPEVGMLATDNFTGQSPCWEDPPADPAVEPVPVEAIVTRSRFGVCGVVIRRECFD